MEKSIASRSWWRANRWLVCRRTSQALILLGFLSGPLWGLWIIDGNFAASVILGTLSLAEPFVVLQQLAAGYLPPTLTLAGAGLLLAFYALVGGRLFCSWVCPINPVTDAAGWLRSRLGLPNGRLPPKATRYWLLAGTLAAAWASGSLLWERVNPVTLLPRELLFGIGWGSGIVGAVFIYDLLVAKRGWCGHLCPMGAFYALTGRFSLLRVSARRRSACTDCADCFAICPEPLVIQPALKGSGSPMILGSACTNCGRCIDVCEPQVFRFALRFDRQVEAPPAISPPSA